MLSIVSIQLGFALLNGPEGWEVDPEFIFFTLNQRFSLLWLEYLIKKAIYCYFLAFKIFLLKMPKPGRRTIIHNLKNTFETIR